jgi:hypothetical protein
MFKEEARWLANIIYSLNPNTVFPILNIGSSNQKFREHEQPGLMNYYSNQLEQKATQ